MRLKELMQALEGIAPFSLQESYDNSGIQIGSPDQEISRALICLDVTEKVLREAKERKCDLILCHHPLIFKGITRLTAANATERIIMEAVRQGIAIVAVHTNLDNVYDGVNNKLASVIGLKNLKVLKPSKGLLKKLVTFCPTEHADKVRAAIFEAGAGKIGDYDCCSFNLEGKGSFRAGENTNPYTGSINELHYEPEVRIETIFPAYLQPAVLSAMFASHPYEEVAYDIYPLDNLFNKVGSGMIGDFDTPMSEKGFLEHLKKTLNISFLRHTAFIDQPVSRVAVCGGSGAFLLPDAMKAGVQAFVTGDVKYHQFFEADRKILLIDAGHYETEQHTKELLHSQIKKKLTNFALLISEVDENPVLYY